VSVTGDAKYATITILELPRFSGQFVVLVS
jgi:hypothetical protein